MASNGNNRPNPQGKRTMSKKAKAKKKRKRIILFTVEIFVLLIMLVVLYGVLKTEKVQRYTINEDDVVFNENVEENEALKGFRNVALFGVDSREGALGKGARTDTIMVASINEDTKEVRLVSVYRDTFLNRGNDTYDKCNSAYAKGGPEQAINMLNKNLDLNITDFVTIGFVGMVDMIDELGGVMIDVDSAELEHINNYQQSISEDLGRKYKNVTSTGYQLLDGMQATAYCRIRFTAGDDFKRAERQREILTAISEKAKEAKASTLNNIANKVFPSVATSLKLEEILGLLKDVSSYKIGESAGFPFDLVTGNIQGTGSSVVPVDLKGNVQQLHEFLFDETAYEVSSDVETYSTTIKNKTDKYVGNKAVQSPMKK